MTTYRTELFDGREHAVFPAVLAIEGVLNGAFVSAAELAKSAPAWNGRAIPLLHPEQLGAPISVASSPDVLERTVGTVFNADVKNRALVAELWIDPEKMRALGAGEVLEAMQAGELIEVSTGYFSDDVMLGGVVNGRSYSTRHTNLRPDHLALLPGQVGACSIADGCGVPRTFSSKEVINMANILRNQQHTTHAAKDAPVSLTIGELKALIAEVSSAAVKDYVAKHPLKPLAGGDQTDDAMLAANFGSVFGDEPLAMTSNRLNAEAAKARRERRERGDVDDFTPSDDSLASATAAAQRRRRAA